MTETPIDRREALRRTALALGGLLSAPTLAAMLAGCDTPPAGEAGWTPLALSSAQGELVATIAEHIIPATDTPGARAVGVHRFIDVMLAEYYAADDRAAFLAGLADVDHRAQAAHGAAFTALTPAQQRDMLTALDREAYAARVAPAAPRPSDERGGDAGGRTENATGAPPMAAAAVVHSRPGRQPFFRTIKELTLLGYYTSQVGATRELKYAQVPGRFDGCIPFASVGRAWST